MRENLEKFLNSESASVKATKVMLAILAVCGVLVISAMAPNVFQILGKRYRRMHNYKAKTLNQAVYRLKKQNLIEVIKEEDDRSIVRLTKNGKVKIRELAIDTLKIGPLKHWDKKWRVVIFDIPNKYKPAREALRKKLRELGFYQLQKSVWAYPFPCEDEILFISEVFGIGRFIEILTVEDLLYESKLKNYFKL